MSHDSGALLLKRMFEKCLAVKTATTSTKSADADSRNTTVLQPATAVYSPLDMASLVSVSPRKAFGIQETRSVSEGVFSRQGYKHLDV